MARFQKSSSQSPKGNAGLTTSPAPRRPKQPVHSVEDTMFFPRLRRHAKWVFVLLALFFGLGFVAFGVGAGGVGFGDIFRGGGSSGPSVKDARDKTTQNPADPEAWRDLSTALATSGDQTGATDALKRASDLRPDDTNLLRELAASYQTLAIEKQREAQIAQLQTAYRTPVSPGGGLLADGKNVLGEDPIAQANANASSAEITAALSESSLAATNSLNAFKRIGALQPDDPTVQLELAQAAETSGDTATAIAAYERFLVLAPDDPNARLVKQQIKRLKG